MTPSTALAAIAANRSLHIAETAEDFAAACQAVRTWPENSGRAHWILCPIRPTSKVDLPPAVEWIRLPDVVPTMGTGHDGNGTWLATMKGFVEALNPEVIIVHSGFATHNAALLADVERVSSAKNTVLHVAGPHDSPRRNAPGDEEPLKIGYVLKKFPRYSETFILREVLALESLGASVQILSLHLPRDGRFHGSLGALAHTVEYMPELSSSKTFATVLSLLPEDRATREIVTELFWETLDRDDPGAVLGYLMTAIQVAARAKAIGLSHLHSHFATSATEVARMAARIAGITYSFTAHAKDIYAHDVDRGGLELKFRDCAFAVTVCRANERFLHENIAASRGKVLCLYNGIDLERLAAGVPVADSAMTTPVDVLAVGRFVEKKGFGLLLDAIAHLRSQGTRVRCRILGDGELLPAMRERRARLQLDGEVDLPGAVSSEQVHDAMRSATILACPCVVAQNGDQDALPTVLLEALALGLPAVATSVSGIDEILDGGRAGKLVEPTVESLAGGINELLQRPDRRRELCEAGRVRAASHFDVRKNVETLLRAFRTHAARTR